jgi:hypothetical protein
MVPPTAKPTELLSSSIPCLWSWPNLELSVISCLILNDLLIFPKFSIPLDQVGIRAADMHPTDLKWSLVCRK